jgi:protein ImuB
MSRVPRTAPLFDERPAAPPPAAPGQTPPLPPEPPAPRAPAPHRARTQELWAAVQLPPHAALEPLAVAAQRFTPRVSLEPPDALLLELRGSVGLFGGLASLLARLQAGFTMGTVALAPTPLAALTFARAGKACCITDPARLVSRLSPLPLAGLRWPEEAVARLFAMGVRTIGEALRLPRAGFAQRFGTTLLASLDRLVGRSADPRAVFAAAPRFRQRCELSFELADTALILRATEPMLTQLETFLRERQRGIVALRLTLQHRALPATVCLLRLASPEHRAEVFARLLAARLESLRLPGPVRRCVLQSGPLLQYAVASEGLWQPGEHGGASSPRLPVFLERLRARLGEAAVQGLALVPGHRPERLSVAAVPALRSAAPGRAAARARCTPPPEPPWAPGTRPLWLLPEPQRLDAAADGSGYPCEAGRRLALLAGPERLETGWWDCADIARDYYVAADADGARLWIFRLRDGSGCWFLHGRFG